MALANIIRQNAITDAGTSGNTLAITGDKDTANKPVNKMT